MKFITITLKCLLFLCDIIVMSMSKSQITLTFSNLMIAHNELSFFEFRNFFFTIQFFNIIIYLRFSNEFLNIFYC